MNRKRLVISILSVLAVVAAVWFGCIQVGLTLASTTYYVAIGGSDSNPGTDSEPFRTIQRGVDAAQAGDTVYVRAGTYHEAIEIENSGTESFPIIIAGYPGERPVIDGQYQLPTGPDAECDPVTGNCYNWGALVSIEGSHIVFEGFEVKRSRGRGIRIWPNDHNTVRDCWAHDNRRAGVLTEDSGYLLIENCKVWLAGDFAPYPRGDELYWTGGIVTQHSSHVVIRGSEVFNNWGEGIIPIASDHITIEDNIVYDNFAVNIYPERSSHVTVQRNLMYHTNEPPFLRGGNPCPCLGFTDEPQFTGPFLGSDYTVINNLAVGCSENFFYWSGKEGSGLRNTLIAHNTFVNAVSNPGMLQDDGFLIHPGVHENVRIENNIILQDERSVAQVVDDPALSFSNNLWSRIPPSHVQSTNDVVGDPQLADPDAPLVAGAVNADWYTLQASSPAIGAGKVTAEVTEDFFGNARGDNPSMGAFEYVEETPTSTPTSTSTPTPPMPTAIYYVAPDGDDSNPGTESQPWRTIGKANAVLQPGDTVFIRAGTYAETIQPANSGTAGQRITYANYNDEKVLISDVAVPLVLSSRSYITIKGIEFRNVDYYLQMYDGDYNHIEYCTFADHTGEYISYGGIHIGEGSTHNWIHHCSISHFGDYNDTVGGWGDIVQIEGPYNLIEDNEIFHGGHSTLGVAASHNVIRDNYFHNEAWNNGYGKRCMHTITGADGHRNNLIEGNRFAFARRPNDVTYACGIQMSSSDNIVRYNSFYDNEGNGLSIGSWYYTDGGWNEVGNNNHIYNNVFFHNGILNAGEGSYDIQQYGLKFEAHSGLTIVDTVIKNNIFYENVAGPIGYFGNAYPEDQVIVNNWESGDPLFVNDEIPTDPFDSSLPDFHLQATSPAIDAGIHLAEVIGDGSGTTLVVDDSMYFCDGFGIVEADWIKIGSGEPVQIQSVDYDTNTIVLEETRSWLSADPVYLYKNSSGQVVLYGSAPDMGAHEYTEEAPPTPTATSTMTSTPTPVITPTVTASPTVTATPWYNDCPTDPPTPTLLPTNTPWPNPMPTYTPEPTPTCRPTATMQPDQPTYTPEATPSPYPTNTPWPDQPE